MKVFIPNLQEWNRSSEKLGKSLRYIAGRGTAKIQTQVCLAVLCYLVPLVQPAP